MTYLVSILISLLLAVFACVFYYFYNEKIKLGNMLKRAAIIRIFKPSRVTVSLIVVCLIIGVIFGWAYDNSDENIMILAVKQITLCTLFLISIIDYQKKMILNQLVLFIFVVGLLSLLKRFMDNPSSVESIFYPALLGMVVGGGILLVANVITRKGSIGAGDVKLFAAIGFVLGFSDLIGAMFYCFLFSAIIGLILLVFKKAKMHDSIAMAPFAFLGVFVAVLFAMRGI